MHGVFDEVKCPFVEQLTAMGGRYWPVTWTLRWAPRYRRSGNARGCVKTQKNSDPSKTASQNACYAVFSVLGMVTLPTDILRYRVFTQPGPISDLRTQSADNCTSLKTSPRLESESANLAASRRFSLASTRKVHSQQQRMEHRMVRAPPTSTVQFRCVFLREHVLFRYCQLKDAVANSPYSFNIETITNDDI